MKSKNKINKTNNYFQQASTWADDVYANVEASRNRWRAVSLFGLTPAVFLLLLSLVFLIPMQHLEPLLINHYTDGQISVMPISNKNIPSNSAQIQSDIVRYVMNREAYSAYSYHYQYTLVNLLSSAEVANHYIEEQDSDNKQSPISVLGNKGTRTVHIDSVLFLDKASENTASKDKKTHINLAQVNFTVTTTDEGGLSKTRPFTALVSWEYRGTPSNEEALWQNWDGFTITHYDVEQRNVA